MMSKTSTIFLNNSGLTQLSRACPARNPMSMAGMANQKKLVVSAV
jgi:hypothetical protein